MNLDLIINVILFLVLQAKIPPLFILFMAMMVVIIGVRIYRSPGLIYINPFVKGLTFREIQVLSRVSIFYRNLPKSKRKKFTRRVKMFLMSKTISGKEGLEIDDEKKLIIAQSAVKLTFGLDVFEFPSFQHILVFPDEFYSPFTRTQNIGETNARGMIVFSWKAYEFGISDPDDNLNIGLHEFAHALVVEHKRMGIDQVFSNDYRDFTDYANQNMRDYEEHNRFRDYAFTNNDEFFAVAVEYFYESPATFKDEMPGLYSRMCRLLNLDPLDYES